jgi:hypothetical protein
MQQREIIGLKIRNASANEGIKILFSNLTNPGRMYANPGGNAPAGHPFPFLRKEHLYS